MKQMTQAGRDREEIVTDPNKNKDETSFNSENWMITKANNKNKTKEKRNWFR
jgi:hypothetical protein